jgi:outer membrane protein
MLNFRNKHIMKYFTLMVFVAALLLVLPGVAPAQDKKDQARMATRVAVVDIERVSKEAVFFRQMVKEIEGDLKSKQAAIEKNEKEYTTLRDEFARKESVLSKDQADSMRKKLRDLRSKIDDDRYEINRMLRDSERSQMAPAMERILKTIREVAKDEKIDLVLRTEVVLHAEPWVDITDKVIGALNAEDKAGSSRKPAVADNE